MDLWRPASRGRQVAHVHLTLEKLQELPEATKQDSAIYPTGPYLPDRRQPKDPRQRPGVREWLEGHPRIESTLSSPKERRGSTSSRAGGVFSDDRPLPESALRLAPR